MKTNDETPSGYLEGERLAKVSVWTLVALGVVEIAAGQFTGSVGLMADGIDSISDGFVSLLVWLGLKMSRKAPDEKFHFGYYKVETLVAFATSIGLMGIGAAIIYRSYLAFLEPKPLTLPILALGVLLTAGTVSLYRAFQMRRVANKYNIVSLRLDANNAIKDGSASFLVFFTVLASTFGFYQMDAIGGIGIGAFIIFVSYVVLKETALVLLDAYHNPQLVEEIRKIVESNRDVSVKDVLLRRVGSYVHAEIHLAVDGTMTVGRLDEIKSFIEAAVKDEFAGIQRVVVSARVEPS